MSLQSVLGRLITSAAAELPSEYARHLLKLKFNEDELARHQVLSEKAQLGTLSHDERSELEDLLVANDVLIVLQANAELSLRKPAVAPEAC
jgi:hypothetical protein